MTKQTPPNNFEFLSFSDPQSTGLMRHHSIKQTFLNIIAKPAFLCWHGVWSLPGCLWSPVVILHPRLRWNHNQGDLRVTRDTLCWQSDFYTKYRVHVLNLGLRRARRMCSTLHYPFSLHIYGRWITNGLMNFLLTITQWNNPPPFHHIFHIIFKANIRPACRRPGSIPGHRRHRILCVKTWLST